VVYSVPNLTTRPSARSGPASGWATAATAQPGRGWRVADGKGANWTKAIGNADDFDDADGTAILDYWQAQEKTRTLGRGERGAGSAKPLTVGETLDAYEADLKTRGGDCSNVSRVRGHLSQVLRARVVALLAPPSCATASAAW
jgi:hypothetical protein